MKAFLEIIRSERARELAEDVIGAACLFATLACLLLMAAAFQPL